METCVSVFSISISISCWARTNVGWKHKWHLSRYYPVFRWARTNVSTYALWLNQKKEIEQGHWKRHEIIVYSWWSNHTKGWFHAHNEYITDYLGCHRFSSLLPYRAEKVCCRVFHRSLPVRSQEHQQTCPILFFFSVLHLENVELSVTLHKRPFIRESRLHL